MKNTRLFFSRAALRVALLLIRFGRRVLPTGLPSLPQVRSSAQASEDSTALIPAATPQPANRERPARLEVPFFIETETELVIANTTGGKVETRDKGARRHRVRNVPGVSPCAGYP